MPVYLIAGEEMDIRVDVEDDCSLRLYIDGDERGHYLDGKKAAEHLGMALAEYERLDATIADLAMLVARLACNAKDLGLRERALDFLKRNDLLETPLITGREMPCSKTPDTSKPSESP